MASHIVLKCFDPHCHFYLQAVWALGNIAGDSTECRDFVIDCNILPSLVQWVAIWCCVVILCSCSHHACPHWWVLSQAAGQTKPSHNDEECRVGTFKPVQREEPTSRLLQGKLTRDGHFKSALHMCCFCLPAIFSCKNKNTDMLSRFASYWSLFFFTLRCLRVSAFCRGYCSSMTRTFWLMHAGRCPIYLMAPMTKYRQWLTLECVAGWWSCWRKTSCKCIMHCFVRGRVIRQRDGWSASERLMCRLQKHCQQSLSYRCEQQLSDHTFSFSWVAGTLIIRWCHLHCERSETLSLEMIFRHR